MNLTKKAISAATSAALLASLFATVVAPAAFASVTVTSVGSIPVNGTSSGTATFLFTERSQGGAACPVGGAGGTSDGKTDGLIDAAGSMTLTIDGPTADQVSFSGTPVVSAPDSLKATASAAGKTLVVSWTHSDCANIETISITGLKIKAIAGATPGPVSATFTSAAGTGNGWAAFFKAPDTATATGTIQSSDELTAGGPDTANILVSSVCRFVSTASNAFNSNATFSDAADARAVTASQAFPLTNGIQSVTFAAGTLAHAAGVVVTQTVAYADACPGTVISSAIGVIGNAVKVTTDNTLTVYPGENNGLAGYLRATEPSNGFLPKDTTLTWTIATDGVVFSKAPPVVVVDSTTGTQMTTSAAVLSADRKTVVVTVTRISGNAASITLGNVSDPVKYDVAATVAGGTYVDVNLTLSGGLLVTGNPVENAIVFRGITASAPTPTVYIGENNQATGLVTLTEAAKGFFNSGTGANNVLTVCDTGVAYDFTTAPWAKVTAGDLRLREGTVSSPDNIVQGTATPDSSTGTLPGCYSWTVWTASTTASTIVIGNADFSAGPLINVSTAQAPGIVAMVIKSGNGSNFDPTIATVGFAVAAYRNQVAVTALSQPFIAPGATNAPAGNIQIAETGLGQLKAGEAICVEVLWRSGEVQDQFLNSLATADLPLATASGTGLVIGPLNYRAEPCTGSAGIIPTGYMGSFTFTVLQQSTKGDGKIVISNIRYTTLTDSAEGPVQLSVWGTGGSPTNVIFHSTVSNAKIGAGSTISIGAVSALGLKPTTGYSTKTPKTQVKGKYITWKFTGGSALAGQRVNVLVAKKISGAWGGPKYLKSAWADANGIVTFAWKSSTAVALNVRVQWPGGASNSVSTSKALGAYWK